MGKTNPRDITRARRKAHIRKVVSGSADRPRLSIYRSANHMYAQVINDETGTTLAAASTLSPELQKAKGHKGNASAAAKVGALIAKKAKAAGVTSVRFDRNGFLYHGRVKALADAAREAGLEF